MAEEQSERQLRRRRSAGNPNLPLNLDVGCQVNEGETSRGTPSPSYAIMGAVAKEGSSALLEFRKKQQSFDIQIEECEEEEIAVDSDDEGANEEGAVGGRRPVTPVPIQDFAANVVHSEAPQNSNFLTVSALDQDCITDVSDADTDEEE